MHELSVACQIVDAAIVAAGPGHSGEIAVVHVTMAPESHLDPGILTDAFAMAATGSSASAARLEIEPGPQLALTAIEVT